MGRRGTMSMPTATSTWADGPPTLTHPPVLHTFTAWEGCYSEKWLVFNSLCWPVTHPYDPSLLALVLLLLFGFGFCFFLQKTHKTPEPVALGGDAGEGPQKN